MLKTLTETFEERIINREESLTEDTQERISPESVQAAFNGLNALHKKYFPKAESFIQLSSLGLASIFWVSSVYARSQWPGGYIENDPNRASFSIKYKGAGKYVVELISGASLKVKPGPDTIYAFDTVKLPFRKYSGTPEQIMIRLEDWEKKRKAAIEENAERMI